jgi:hypothetical protein
MIGDRGGATCGLSRAMARPKSQFCLFFIGIYIIFLLKEYILYIRNGNILANIINWCSGRGARLLCLEREFDHLLPAFYNFNPFYCILNQIC